ncbi:MAG: inositol 2-dehydrogenase [Anaerolineae bacterium]|nr:inositol 2-dehydrogenase [Anaerolineae bacterium]
MVNMGLIGAGRIGRVHAGHLAHHIPAARLAAVADINPTAAADLAGRFGVPAYGDHRYVLDDPDIAAVAICSSTDTHARLIIEAAQAGKHIFCEKPIDLDLARIDEALAAVEAAGVKLMVGFNRRFDPSFRKARELVQSGAIGAVHLVRITSRDPAPPPLAYVRVSGGLFLDMTIHDFDMARYLGGEIEEVFAAGSVLVDPDIGAAGDIDTAIVLLHLRGGALGAIDNSRQAVYGYDQRVEVFGSAGMVAVGNRTPDTHVLSDAHGVHSARPLYFFMERYTESFLAEMTAFVECLVEDKPPPVSGRDGRQAVVIALAAQRSLRERRPVSVAEVAG